MECYWLKWGERKCTRLMQPRGGSLVPGDFSLVSDSGGGWANLGDSAAQLDEPGEIFKFQINFKYRSQEPNSEGRGSEPDADAPMRSGTPQLRGWNDGLVVTDVAGADHRLIASEIARREGLALSLMPAGLGKRIGEAEFADLLSYLLGQKGR
jgi:hypothetical protein